MLDTIEARRLAYGKGRPLWAAVEVESPRSVVRGGGMVPGVANGDRRGAKDWMVQTWCCACRRLLEVRGQNAIRCSDTEEEVHVFIGTLGVILSTAFGNEWDGIRNTSRTRACANSGRSAFEPGLDRER
jgi:hypothetical protein